MLRSHSWEIRGVTHNPNIGSRSRNGAVVLAINGANIIYCEMSLHVELETYSTNSYLKFLELWGETNSLSLLGIMLISTICPNS
ncbi:hypothetical protein HZS_2656 [Henneguya salminicola]|nr:hypothetical protein HZS_2656 [Henneguya salminicola]